MMGVVVGRIREDVHFAEPVAGQGDKGFAGVVGFDATLVVDRRSASVKPNTYVSGRTNTIEGRQDPSPPGTSSEHQVW